jgi:hypothetical protein
LVFEWAVRWRERERKRERGRERDREKIYIIYLFVSLSLPHSLSPPYCPFENQWNLIL